MSGIEIFFVGGILLCCVVMVAWLMFDVKQRMRDKPDSPPDKQETEKEPATETERPTEETSCIGASSFEIDRLEELMEKVAKETFKTMIPLAMNEIAGDVNQKDVEFAPDPEETADEKPEPEKRFSPMTSEEIADAFETDIRDFDDSGPAAPMAKGATLDEIEEAFDTALSPDATPEQQAEAGKVLSEVKDTELYDRLASTNDDIDRKVNLCIKMSIKADIEARNAKMSPPRRKVVSKTVSVEIPMDDPDGFDLASLLP